MDYEFLYNGKTYELDSLTPHPDPEKYHRGLAMWTAICAAAAYSNSQEAASLLGIAGFTDTKSFKSDGTEAIVAYHANEGDPFSILAFRGTQEACDWRTNFNFRRVRAETICDGCRVHRGFSRALDAVWRDHDGKLGIRTAILDSQRDGPHPIYMTGHSLGGALAILASYRLDDETGVRPTTVYTIGSPRVGNSRLAACDAAPIYRVVNHDDWVPRLPPGLFLYRHAGYEHWFGAKRSKDLILTPEPSPVERITWFNYAYGSLYWTFFKMAAVWIAGLLALGLILRWLTLDPGLWGTILLMPISWVASFAVVRTLARRLPKPLSRLLEFTIVSDHFRPKYLDLIASQPNSP